MWRQTSVLNHDSDQSISEEEFDCDSLDNCVSLGVHADTAGCSSAGAVRPSDYEGFQLQSRLLKLRGDHGLNLRTLSNLSHEEQKSFPVEDELEMPDFPDESNFIGYSKKDAAMCNSAEEVISHDENNTFPKYSASEKINEVNLCSSRSELQDRSCTWAAASKEAEALIHLNDNAYCAPSYTAKRPSKGVRRKAKPRFSFHFHSMNDGNSLPSIKDENDMSFDLHEVPERSENIEQGTADSPIDEHPEDVPEKGANHLENTSTESETLAHGCMEHSMTDLLHGLQDNAVLVRGNSKMYSRTRGGRIQLVEKRSLLSFKNRIIDSEDQPEPLSSGSSSDNEANQHLKFDVLEMKGQTMTDRFHQALGAASFSCEGALFVAPKTSGIGLFGKLQQVIQSEKDQDADFLKSQVECCLNNEPNCIDVKILSRYLDAKLIVCRCFLAKNIEGCQEQESSNAITNGENKTVVFHPRVCSNVDLEVGNLIRIHPPWKEMQVMATGENIILSTYFYQISV
ncbi:uncharacterized protein LOC120003958 isoform X1 [Tripterygium wilfordii]|uniref:uncharacterized protein LOC120003958 isoform X1 n=1 Tax=Tripterygium wilfordii TaxID=458696 RepID=UPI0018F829A2|nr:uncharacterized protein LOC120003958 isoform X1 [Tripterygium wilfordii]